MFFYLSFLRAPPLEATTRSPVSIMPQIANDLRTELFPDTVDIYYSWFQESSISVGLQPTAISTTTRLCKLTTWRPENAYKDIGVPLPSGVRDGQSWRLLLTVQDSTQAHVIHLKGEEMGKSPFPALSMPIWFAPHLPLSPAKQAEIERVFRFPSSYRENAYLTIREHTSFDLDKVILLPQLP
jgi:hypothetical protein